ncbi:MAG: hypothetical protein ACR2HH_03625 [Chthoniobacterales bacterium]
MLSLGAFAQTQRAADRKTDWPSLGEQLTKEYLGRKVQKHTALEALVRNNQNFPLLRDDGKTTNDASLDGSEFGGEKPIRN